MASVTLPHGEHLKKMIFFFWHLKELAVQFRKLKYRWSISDSKSEMFPNLKLVIMPVS
jgi:hypothetical protein